MARQTVGNMGKQLEIEETAPKIRERCWCSLVSVHLNDVYNSTVVNAVALFWYGMRQFGRNALHLDEIELQPLCFVARQVGTGGTQKDRKPRVCGPDSSAERCSIGFHRSRAGCRRYHGIILVCRVIAEINYVRDEILGRQSVTIRVTVCRQPLANVVTRRVDKRLEKIRGRSAVVSGIHKNRTHGVTGSTVDPWLTSRERQRRDKNGRGTKRRV
ncbi:hypothetical protein WN51_11382 [Melipona quadrifasciata]|uniref:Uncharacterized protein n=1 Tax=Melipona quadrifasciata TaxID=166423 RepID=A0A0N0BK02_9HYME|nr:hypothetical protein WN51_11382 [Melipona quadrifasciata]